MAKQVAASHGLPLVIPPVAIAAAPDAVYQRLVARLENGPRILQRGGDFVVAEFQVRVGRFQITTVERVDFDPVRRRLEFRQLRSPFWSIRTAIEIFEVTAGPDGGAVLTVQGMVWPRWGALGRLVTQWVVLGRWEQIDAGMLRRLQQELQPAS